MERKNRFTMEIEITAEGCDEEQAVLEIEAFLKNE